MAHRVRCARLAIETAQPKDERPEDDPQRIRDEARKDETSELEEAGALLDAEAAQNLHNFRLEFQKANTPK